MNNKLMILTIGVLFVVCVGVAFFTFALPEARAQAELYPATSPQQISKTDLDQTYTYVLYVVLLIAGIWMISRMARSPIGIFALFIIAAIVVVGGLGWWFQSSSPSLPHNMVINVVQPSGNNPDVDAQYAKINDANAGANIKEAATLSIYAGIGWVFLLLIGVFALILLARHFG